MGLPERHFGTLGHKILTPIHQHEQCTCYTHDSSTVVVIHEGDVPGGLFRLYLHANSQKCNGPFSVPFLRNYSSENKFPANVLASAVMKVCIGDGKIFSRIQSGPIAAENTFSFRKCNISSLHSRAFAGLINLVELVRSS